MNKEAVFAIWSPEPSLWSTWAKPVLFAYADMALPEVPTIETTCDVNWAPSPQEKTVLVLDLPGAEGVWAAVALAARGYRPVPLYNAVPLPSETPLLDPLTGRSVVAVNVLPIIRALNDSAPQLANCNLPPDAPPVFLLDADRHGNWRKMQPDEFDNRSICFTTDFPSANFLWTQGIRHALVVQKTSTVPHPDLTHVLRRWQDGGLSLERVRVDFPAKSEPFEVPRPSWYGAMFQRVLSAFGLRRAGSGGFGAWMPESPAGG